MLEEEIYLCVSNVESRLGRKLAGIRGLVDQEPEMAFEQLCDVIDDEPFELEENLLGRLRSIAEKTNNASSIEILADLKPGDASRTWMTESDVAALPPAADLKTAADEIRQSNDFSRIAVTLEEQLGRAPSTLELTRFVRMIAPDASLDVAIKITAAVEASQPDDVARLLNAEIG